MTDIFQRLAAEFPREAVHWRAQTISKNKDKALALAYIDARDVQDRLDSVCTPAGWRNTVVETPKGRVLSTIEIKIGDEWIGKCDGAGDTDVEGDKGGISDAFKRSAVLWGIGRYLYRLPTVWAPCEVREHNGKTYWQAWKGSPWDCVRTRPAAVPASPAPAKPVDAATFPPELEPLFTKVDECETQQRLAMLWKDEGEAAHAEHGQVVADKFNRRKASIAQMDRVAA